MLTIFTDSDTDITLSEANELGIKLISMPYIIQNEEVKPYIDFIEFDYSNFYDVLRKGVLPKTCAINTEAYRAYFEPEFEKGNDVLYIHFSRNMSGTFNAMDLAIKELNEQYPERKFYTIDTKGITILSNIIVKDVVDLFKKGLSIEEVLKWSEDNVDKYATYFFADSLKFFARSGRVSNFAGLMGNLIGIKPIIYMDENGTMTNIGKEKGKKKAISRLIECFDQLAVDPKGRRIVIGHSDSYENAKVLGDLLVEKYGELNIEYVVVNPTAGSHCGPDTIGIAFYAKRKTL